MCAKIGNESLCYNPLAVAGSWSADYKVCFVFCREEPTPSPADAVNNYFLMRLDINSANKITGTIIITAKRGSFVKKTTAAPNNALSNLDNTLAIAFPSNKSPTILFHLYYYYILWYSKNGKNNHKNIDISPYAA
ncbi:hypothetical protein SDC9_144082 [bioreactor metagenome]|uniref:Uncharacterized protein n=1 Tax=bioreactor metagenome TaxID=1076179 RepID=A0A645E7Z6_9ZZZZ